MFLSTPRIIFAILILSAVAAYAAQADQPPPPQNSKAAVPAAPAKDPARKPAQAAPAGGVVVFIDPATGKVRQPDPSEIGTLSPAPGTVPDRASATLLQGPGGAVGTKLDESMLVYMVVTTAPDGKLAMDCVTGDKAAATRVASSQPPSAKETSKDPARAQDAHRAQEPHDVKVPR
ncbi:MAG: hypothetical protein LAQ69_30725 [Acidobacteriia bacterium]|nr:hypothetical protein [Terriglobia bacterium]